MINLEEITELVQDIKVSYKPHTLQSKPLFNYKVEIVYNAADDQMIGEDLDDGWFKEMK